MKQKFEYQEDRRYHFECCNNYHPNTLWALSPHQNLFMLATMALNFHLILFFQALRPSLGLEIGPPWPTAGRMQQGRPGNSTTGTLSEQQLCYFPPSKLCCPRREGFVLDEGLKDFWARFTDKSDEKFFRKFVKGFVAQWEGKVCPNWEMMVTARLEGEKDEGPRLADLPEELLPALSKFLFVGEDEAEEVCPSNPSSYAKITIDILNLQALKEKVLVVL